MIKDGYMIEAEPIEVLNSFRIPELKGMLKELDQSVSGKKAVLHIAMTGCRALRLRWYMKMTNFLMNWGFIHL